MCTAGARPRALTSGAGIAGELSRVRAGMSLAGRTFGSIAVQKIALPNYSLSPA
jgi:hypothetical protein